MGKHRIKPNYRRRVLRLPDLDHCKLAVLNSLGSLGCKQNLGHPVNDLFELRTEERPHANDDEPATVKTPDPVEKASGQGVECRHGGSEHDQPVCDSYQNEPIWSRSEKAIARKAFDAALGRELHEVIQEAKNMASQIQQSSDLWDLEHYLTQRRKEIDRKYDFRGSRLTDVLGRLLHENRLREEELRGLREDKMKPIRSCAKFLAEEAA